MKILIKNGMVVDPKNNIYEKKTIGIEDGKISYSLREDDKDCMVIDAKDTYVLPGLIDFHVHVNDKGSEWGFNPDLLVSSGVTSVVDAGSSGTANYEAMRTINILNKTIKVKALLSINPIGLASVKIHQTYNPEYFDEAAIKRMVEKYPEEIIGLKIMYSEGLISHDDLEPLKKLVDIANQVGNLRIVVHVTNLAIDLEDLIDILRPGDVFCHMFQGNTGKIVDEEYHVKEVIKKAREKGILFDAAHGLGHFDHRIAKSAIDEKFMPDIISTDLTKFSYNKTKKVRDLPYVMSLFLALGMEFKDIVQRVTMNPANLMTDDPNFGSLTEGAVADITIMKKIQTRVEFLDTKNNPLEGEELLIPQMTIIDGEIVYKEGNFNL